MKKLYSLFTFILLSNTILIHAAISESYAITDVLKYLDRTIAPKDTLIVFDLDNTLIESVDQMGSPQQFSALLRKKMALHGLTKEEALEQTLPLYTVLAQHTLIKPIEDTTINLVDLLQKAGYKVMGLTARTADKLADFTCKQLQDIHIDFTKSAISKKNIKCSEFDYQCNIIFADGGNKGELLLKFLKDTKYHPKKIIFVDDKDYNVYAIEGSLQQKGINHMSIHYRFCDKKAQQFDLASTEHILLSLAEEHPDIKAAYQKYLANPADTTTPSIAQPLEPKALEYEKPSGNQPTHN